MLVASCISHVLCRELPVLRNCRPFPGSNHSGKYYSLRGKFPSAMAGLDWEGIFSGTAVPEVNPITVVNVGEAHDVYALPDDEETSEMREETDKKTKSR